MGRRPPPRDPRPAGALGRPPAVAILLASGRPVETAAAAIVGAIALHANTLHRRLDKIGVPR